jgi:hypothetical protein
VLLSQLRFQPCLTTLLNAKYLGCDDKKPPNKEVKPLFFFINKIKIYCCKKSKDELELSSVRDRALGELCWKYFYRASINRTSRHHRQLVLNKTQGFIASFAYKENCNFVATTKSPDKDDGDDPFADYCRVPVRSRFGDQ